MDYHRAVVVQVTILDAVLVTLSDLVVVVLDVARDKDGFGREMKVLDDVVVLEEVDPHDEPPKDHEDGVEMNEMVDQHGEVDLEVEDRNDVELDAD